MKTKTPIISDYPFASLRATEELAPGVKFTFLLHQRVQPVGALAILKALCAANLLSFDTALGPTDSRADHGLLKVRVHRKQQLVATHYSPELIFS